MADLDEKERGTLHRERILHGVEVVYYSHYTASCRADADRAELQANAGGGCYTTLQFEKDAQFGWSRLDNAISFAKRCYDFGRDEYRKDLVSFLGIKQRS